MEKCNDLMSIKNDAIIAVFHTALSVNPMEIVSY